MIIKYVNSTGKEINLNQYPYRMLISDLLDYEPEVVQNNGKILGFNNDIIVEHELNIDVHKYNDVSSRVWLNKLTLLQHYKFLLLQGFQLSNLCCLLRMMLQN